MRNHPYPAHVLDGKSSQALEQRIRRDGLAMLCPARARIGGIANWCLTAAISRAWCSIPGKWQKIGVARGHLGVDGKPARYLLVTIPPWQVERLPSLRQPIEDYAPAGFDGELPHSLQAR
jgi:hypothetical protein